MSGPDVRWEGVPHQTIVKWANTGPGAALTGDMERALRRAAETLNHASERVDAAVRRAEEWLGGAAESAVGAMRVIRGFDDAMHFTSNQAGIRAFGQSDGAGFVRANVPPVVDVGPPPQPTGLPVDIILATEDYQNRQAEAKQAEQRARDIMRQYTDATRERAAAMTPLTPPPRIVLEVSDGPVRPNPVGGPPAPGSGGPGPAGSAPPGLPGTVRQAGPVSRVSGEVPPPESAPGVTPQASAGATAAPAPGQPSGVAPPKEGGGAVGGGPLGGGGSGRVPVAGRDPLGGGRGSRGGLGPVAERVAPAGRGVSVARPGVAGVVPPLGGSARREEDRDRLDRYAIPSAEHFEPDPSGDPHRAGWHVAPPVIGDQVDDADHQ